MALAAGLFLSTGAFAQDNNDPQNNKKDEKKSNYRSWSVGLTGGANYLLGDVYSKETGKADIHDDLGGIGYTVGLDLTKWVNSALGFQAELGIHSYSGTRSANLIGTQDDVAVAFRSNTAYRGGMNVMVNLNGFGARNRVKERKDAWFIYTGLGFNSAGAEIFINNDQPIELGTNEQNVFSTALFGDERSIGGHRSFYMPIGLIYNIKLNQRFDVSVGMRGTWMLDDNADGSNTITSLMPNVTTPRQLDNLFPNATSDWLFSFTAGVNYYFGWKEPKSKDPIVYIDATTEMLKRIAKNENNLDKLMTDKDGDGVSDFFDKDPNTPEGHVVDGSGVSLDTDGDGVPDSIDEDPFSTPGAVVDAQGREIDSDGDGVPDSRDLEPNTPKGQLVNFQGISIEDKVGGGAGADGAYIPSIFFATDRADITAANQQRIVTVARLMMANPNMRLRVVGNCDVRAGETYNEKLGERRAKAAIKELSKNFGIDESRFEAVTKGKSSPIAKSHAPNRRVDFEIIR